MPHTILSQLLLAYALLWVNQGRGTYMSLIIYPILVFFIEGNNPFPVPTQTIPNDLSAVSIATGCMSVHP